MWKLTIAQRVTAGVGLVSLMSLLSIIGASAWTMREMSEMLVDARMRSTVDVAAIALTDAVIADDLSRIDQLVDRVITAEKGAVRMCVFDQKDQRLSTGRCLQADEEPMPGRVVKETPILVGGQSFGYVGIAYEPSGLVPDLATIERRLFLLGSICLLMTLGVVYFIGAAISAELEAIRSAFSSMAKNGGPRPLRKTATRELDRVAEAFNTLMAERCGVDKK